MDLTDPLWFLDRLDASGERALITAASREILSAQPFLDQNWRRAGRSLWVPLGELTQAAAWPRAEAVLWHTAFCASTLFASCLDHPGVCLALKEPMALPELAAARRRSLPAVTEKVFDGVFGLFGRRFTPEEAILIKPSNAANSLAREGARIGERHLMLYSSCQDFVLAVAHGGPAAGGSELRRVFVRGLLRERLLTGDPHTPWTPEELGGATDLQAAAMLWHAQARELRAAAACLDPSRVRSLEGAVFLADPKAALEQADAFLTLGLGPERIATIATGRKLASYSKEPERAFDAPRRAQELERLEAHLGPALPQIIDWSYRANPDTPVGNPLGAAPLA